MRLPTEGMQMLRGTCWELVRTKTVMKATVTHHYCKQLLNVVDLLLDAKVNVNLGDEEDYTPHLEALVSRCTCSCVRMKSFTAYSRRTV